MERGGLPQWSAPQKIPETLAGLQEGGGDPKEEEGVLLMAELEFPSNLVGWEPCDSSCTPEFVESISHLL